MLSGRSKAGWCFVRSVVQFVRLLPIYYNLRIRGFCTAWCFEIHHILLCFVEPTCMSIFGSIKIDTDKLGYPNRNGIIQLAQLKSIKKKPPADAQTLFQPQQTIALSYQKRGQIESNVFVLFIYVFPVLLVCDPQQTQGLFTLGQLIALRPYHGCGARHTSN